MTVAIFVEALPADVVDSAADFDWEERDSRGRIDSRGRRDSRWRRDTEAEWASIRERRVRSRELLLGRISPGWRDRITSGVDS